MNPRTEPQAPSSSSSPNDQPASLAPRDSAFRRVARALHRTSQRLPTPRQPPLFPIPDDAASVASSSAVSATPTHCGYCLENADTLQGRDLFVQVVRAEHLPAADVDNTSDPYCVVWLGGAHSHKTAIVRRTNNPTWNETVMFTSAQLVEVLLSGNALLTFRVFDHNYMFRDELIGEGCIDLGAINMNERMSGSVVITLQRPDTSPPPSPSTATQHQPTTQHTSTTITASSGSRERVPVHVGRVSAAAAVSPSRVGSGHALAAGEGTCGALRVSLWLGSMVQETPRARIIALSPQDAIEVTSRTTVSSSLLVPPGASKRIPLVVQVPDQQHVIYEEPCMVYLVVFVWELTTVSSELHRLRKRLGRSISRAATGSDRGADQLELLAWERLQDHELTSQVSGKELVTCFGRLRDTKHPRTPRNTITQHPTKTSNKTFHRYGDGDHSGEGPSTKREGGRNIQGAGGGLYHGAGGALYPGEVYASSGGEEEDPRRHMTTVLAEGGEKVVRGVAKNMGRGVMGVGKGALEVARGLKDVLLPEDLEADGYQLSDSDNDDLDQHAEGTNTTGGRLLFEDDTTTAAPVDAGRIFYKLTVQAGEYRHTAVSRVAHEIGGYCKWTRPSVVVLPTPIPHDANAHVTFFYATGEAGSPFTPVATLDLTIASLLGPHAGTFDPRPHGVWVAATATGTAIPNPTPAHPTTSPSHTSVGAGTPSHARCGATTIDADARRVLYNNPLVQLAPGQTTLVQTLYQASQDGGVGGGGVGVGGGGVRGSDKGSTTTSSSTNSDARMSQSTGSPLRDNVGKHDTHHHKHDTNTTSNSTTSNPARLVQGDPQGAPQRDSMQQSGQLGRVGTDAAAAVWVASTGSVTMMQQQQQQLLHAVGQQQGVGSTMPRWKVTQERLRKLRGKSTKQLTQLSVQAVQTTMVNMVKHVCPPAPPKPPTPLGQCSFTLHAVALDTHALSKKVSQRNLQPYLVFKCGPHWGKTAPVRAHVVPHEKHKGKHNVGICGGGGGGGMTQTISITEGSPSPIKNTSPSPTKNTPPSPPSNTTKAPPTTLSTTPPSSQQQQQNQQSPSLVHFHWDWKVDLPLYEPNTMLLITAYPHTTSLWGTPKNPPAPVVLGRLRIRLSAMPPNKLFTVKLPLLSDRSSGSVQVAGHAVVSIQVDWNGTLRALQRYTKPEIAGDAYDLQIAGQVGELEHEYRKHVVAWLASASPPLAAPVARRAWGREREEFFLSRTVANYQRTSRALKAFAGPLDTAYNTLISWHHPWLNICVLVVFAIMQLHAGLVVSVLGMVVVSGALQKQNKGEGPLPMILDPVDPGDPDEPPSELGLSAYKRLKRRYMTLVRIILKLQLLLDAIANVLERLQYMFIWEDPLATLLFVGMLALASAAIAVFGTPICATFALFWLIRPPVLRDPLPPTPLNIFQRLPTEGDRIA